MDEWRKVVPRIAMARAGVYSRLADPASSKNNAFVGMHYRAAFPDKIARQIAVVV
jgi:hypothetical protein